MNADTAEVALVLDLQGTVVAVLGGHLGSPLPVPLEQLLAPGEAARVRALLDGVQARGFVHHLPVQWQVGQGTEPRQLFAARSGDNIILLVLHGAAGAEAWLADLVRINSEQTNALRTLHAELSRNRLPREHEDVFLQLSAVNNELATTQRQLARSNARLTRVVEERNRLLGMVAHDLRNPLAVVMTATELLLADPPVGVAKRRRQTVELIRRRVEFMANLVNDLVDFSAVQTSTLRLNPAHLSLDYLLRDEVDTMQPFARDKGVELTCSTPEDGVSLVGDDAKLRQVVSNLVSNAIKYSHPGSRTTLELTADDAAAVLRVADQGQGIPPHEVPLLFDPYQLTSVRGTAGEKSVGLGLAIVKRILEAHGGQIAVDSEVGRGTTFTVRLPRPPA